MRLLGSIFGLAVLLSACAGNEQAPSPVAVAQATSAPSATPTFPPTVAPTLTSTPTHTPTSLPTETPTATPTATATSTPTSTATPDPFAEFTVDGLTARSYGEGELQVEEVLNVTNAFTRTLITYPSDGLTIYGFMNVPKGEGPFPVVLVLHGYVNPARYNTLTYTTGYADTLAHAPAIW